MTLKKEQVLGVIGGLGPRATTRFLELTTLMTEAAADQDHLNMIVYIFPSIPDRTGYIQGSNLKSPLPGLLTVTRELARQGADQILLPSVTAHYFYEELQRAVTVPIINAVTETVSRLKEAGISRAGIMATEGVILSGQLAGAMAREGIHPVMPSRDRQEDVTHLIYQNIKAGKPPEMDRFHRVCEDMRQRDAQVIVLGCTELSMIKRDQELGAGFLDTMEVLAQTSVIRCGKKLRPRYRNLISR